MAVQQLDKNMSGLRSWLSHIETELSRPIVYDTCDDQEIQRKLNQQQARNRTHCPGLHKQNILWMLLQVLEKPYSILCLSVKQLNILQKYVVTSGSFLAHILCAFSQTDVHFCVYVFFCQVVDHMTRKMRDTETHEEIKA